MALSQIHRMAEVERLGEKKKKSINLLGKRNNEIKRFPARPFHCVG